MKQKQMTAIAVACGLLCAVCVALFMMSVQGEADAARAETLARFGGEQVEVCVATRDIVAGERVDLSAVETKVWIADLLPESALRSTSDVIGKTATSPIYKGEVITEGRFQTDRGSLEVPRGKQAVSLPAKAVQAVGGAIRPGMSVDVYSSGSSTTVAIATDVNVLDTSVGGSSGLSSSENGWITLAVDADRVQELIAASNQTTLYFTLPGEPLDQDAVAESASPPQENGSASSSAAAASSSSASTTSRTPSSAQSSADADDEDADDEGDRNDEEDGEDGEDEEEGGRR